MRPKTPEPGGSEVRCQGKGGHLLTAEKPNQRQPLVTPSACAHHVGVSLLQGHEPGTNSSLSIQGILCIKGPREAIKSIPRASKSWPDLQS